MKLKAIGITIGALLALTGLIVGGGGVAALKGSDALDWTADSGTYRLVVMNADGSRGVSAHGDASVTITRQRPVAASSPRADLGPLPG